MPLTATMYTSGLAKRRSEPLSLSEICFQAAAIIGVLAVPTIGALFIDSRELNDVSVWDKPLKFEASLILHLITLGLLASLFTPEAASRLTIRLAYQVTAAAALGEIFYIVFQAARGRASHFNSSTVFEGTMYGIMGLGAVLLVLCSFIAGLKLLRGSRKETGPGLRLGAASGLMLGSLTTLITAGLLSSGVADGPGHWVGGIHSDAGGLPLTGWSTTGGDLRVPHFFATHTMQVLPLLGLMADRLAERRALQIVAAGALGMIAVIALTFAQALAALPFLRM